MSIKFTNGDPVQKCRQSDFREGMTSFVEADSITVAENQNTKHRHNSGSNLPKTRYHRPKHVLKPKEIFIKLKCNKLLKKKLRKYKLRQDGSEDNDVLDVSKTLLSSLIIKSPNSSENNIDVDYSSALKPKNYLTKMVRRKESITVANSVQTSIIHDKEINNEQDAITSEKKHTNAFQLLMDSRNKTIGSNSPGIEKNDQLDNEDALQNRINKGKRKLVLEKMAVAKGFQKNKEIEEYQDRIIKKKMDKRAERLKNMILKETKSSKLNENIGNGKVSDKPKLEGNGTEEITLESNKGVKKSKAYTIVDIFNTFSEPVSVSPENRHIPKEDKEFLEKLSPSLRKKESMLSYFKKVDKEPELSPDNSVNHNLIKVKLQAKSKRKDKKKKLSLKKNSIVVDDEVNTNIENYEILSDTDIRLPKTSPKCEANIESKTVQLNSELQKKTQKLKPNITTTSDAIVLNNDSRPKRSIKRPVKYTDDACLSSTDEELHIFTPKKKKYSRNNNDNIAVSTKTEPDSNENVIANDKKKFKEEKSITTKAVKLAPIFASKQLDAEALEAKQKFLQSGVPEKLKKIIQKEKKIQMLTSDFPIVVHIQQLHSNVEKVTQKLPTLDCSIDDISSTNVTNIETDCYKKLLNLNKDIPPYNVDNIKYNLSIQTVLQSIKLINPKFPVYRTYRYLRGKRKGEIKNNDVDLNNSFELTSDEVDITNESPDKLSWTDKYKAMCTNQIIGNFDSIRELRKWLISWSENDMKSKSRKHAGSDSSDYYQSDTDSRDSLQAMNNLLILTGPTGCGKTSSVYAVAAELAIKVIEVNASSKRTGKIMLQDLQEATQSHKVNRGTSNTDSSQKSQENRLTEQIKKKKGRPKKSKEKANKRSPKKSETIISTPSSQESTRTAMSLILVDDADIIFDQDDGFTSAIVQLVQCSKRPVILITSSLACPHLQRFFINGKILKICPLLPRMLGTWLDIMCLADIGVSWPGLGARFLNYYKGDIRKTVNYLQFYVSSYAHSITSNEETVSQNIDTPKMTDDENSNMSWAVHEDSEDQKLSSVCDPNVDIDSNSIWTNFMYRYFNLLTLPHPLDLFNIWWSVPHLLSSSPIPPDTTQQSSQVDRSTVKELSSIADVMDAISISDYITNLHPGSSTDISSTPWYSPVTDSVSEQDNIDYYTNKYAVSDEICHTMVTGYITSAQDVLNCDRRTGIRFPGMSMHRNRDKVVTRHKSLTTYLSPWASLDRRSLALDYWSSCRTICRIEKFKSDSQISVKRNNRFCHYLKSLGVLCKSEAFDNLCDSLSDQGTDLKLFSYNEC